MVSRQQNSFRYFSQNALVTKMLLRSGLLIFEHSRQELVNKETGSLLLSYQNSHREGVAHALVYLSIESQFQKNVSLLVSMQGTSSSQIYTLIKRDYNSEVCFSPVEPQNRNK